MVLRHLPKHVDLHRVKQESHRYSLGNGHIDLHAHSQLAEHVPDGEDPSLQDHMHTHLQHTVILKLTLRHKTDSTDHAAANCTDFASACRFRSFPRFYVSFSPNVPVMLIVLDH